MGEFNKFSSELRQYLRRKKATAEKFIQETALQYSKIIAKNDHARDTWLKERLLEVTPLSGINALSNILKNQRSGESGKPDVAFGLYFLAKVDDDFGMVVAPIEQILFGGAKSKPITFDDKFGWEPAKFRIRDEQNRDGPLPPSFPKNILLEDSYQPKRAEFYQAKETLLPRVDESIALSTAIYGAGGYGKSSLARELCNDKKVLESFRGGIYWLQFGLIDSTDESAGSISPSKAVDDMLHSQYPIDLRPSLVLDQKDDNIDALFDILPDEQLLIIADDVWTEKQSKFIQAVPENVSVLITTRRESVASKTGKQIKIEPLTGDSPFKLLTHGMGNLSVDQQTRLLELSKGFKGWPLLLNLANGVFKQQYSKTDSAIERSIEEYGIFLSSYEIAGWDTEEPGENNLEKRRKLVGHCIEYGLTVIPKNNRPDLLRQLTVFADDVEIPFSVIDDLWGQDHDEKIGPVIAKTRRKLFNDYSFFSSYDKDANTLRLHDEILAYFRSCLTELELRSLHEKLLNSIIQHCPGGWDTLPSTHRYGWFHILEHLEKAGFEDEANDLRTDFKWLNKKLNKFGAGELQRSFFPLPQRKDARDTGRAINLSIPVLSKRPLALAHQLFGRLGHHPTGRIFHLLEVAKTDDGFWPKPLKPHLHAFGGELLRLVGHGLCVRRASFNAVGDRVVTASDDGTARIWDAETGKELFCLNGHGDSVIYADFGVENDCVVTTSCDNTMREWSVETGKELHCQEIRGAMHSIDAKRNYAVSAFCFSAIIWDIDTGQEVRRLTSNDHWVNSTFFNLEGNRVVTSLGDNTARIWDAESGEELQTLEGHNQDVSSASFNAKGDQVVTASADKTARIWDVETGVELLRLEGHDGTVASAFFNAKGDRVVTASNDKSARIWDSKAATHKQRPVGHDNKVNSTAFSAGGNCFVTASRDGTVRIWDSGTGLELRRIENQGLWVNFASLDANGSRVVTELSNAAMGIWDVETGKEVLRFESKIRIVSASFNAKGNRVVTGSSIGIAQIWDADTGKLLVCLEGHANRKGPNNDVICAYFNTKGNRVVTSSADNTVRVWDTKAGNEVLRLKPHGNFISSANFNRKGDRIITSGETIQIWDAETGLEVRCFYGQEEYFNSSCFSPNCRHLVTASDDNTVKIWDAETGCSIAVIDFDSEPTSVDWKQESIAVGFMSGQVCVLQADANWHLLSQHSGV